ncbi:unnamed protein product, partial [Urochloa humidicola]
GFFNLATASPPRCPYATSPEPHGSSEDPEDPNYFDDVDCAEEKD